MGASKKVERELAKVLFINEKLSQKAIALRVNVSERTVSAWVIKGKWEEQRKSMTVTKQEQLSMLYDQINWLQIEIRNRERPVADPKEADTIIKLTSAIKKLETELSAAEAIETCMQLLSFIREGDVALADKLLHWCDLFIASKL